MRTSAADHAKSRVQPVRQACYRGVVSISTSSRMALSRPEQVLSPVAHRDCLQYDKRLIRQRNCMRLVVFRARCRKLNFAPVEVDLRLFKAAISSRRWPVRRSSRTMRSWSKSLSVACQILANSPMDGTRSRPPPLALRLMPVQGVGFDDFQLDERTRRTPTAKL